MKTTFVAAVAVLIGVAVFAQGSMRPGQWETTMQMEMPGSPIQMPAMKSARCITPEDAKDPSRSLPTGPQGRGNQKSDCKVSDYKTSGSTVTWKMTCSSPEPMTGTGEMTYTGDTAYNGTMKMDMQGRGMTMKISGMRVGDCPAK
jgi:hypothetical protein